MFNSVVQILRNEIVYAVDAKLFVRKSLDDRPVYNNIIAHARPGAAVVIVVAAAQYTCNNCIIIIYTE